MFGLNKRLDKLAKELQYKILYENLCKKPAHLSSTNAYAGAINLINRQFHKDYADTAFFFFEPKDETELKSFYQTLPWKKDNPLFELRNRPVIWK
jgi:hypothetical protein